MATSKGYAPVTRHLARKIAHMFCIRMGVCECATNRQHVERVLLPILEMFEQDIANREEVGMAFAIDHVATYLARCGEEMARPLHKPGQSPADGSHTARGAAHGIDQ